MEENAAWKTYITVKHGINARGEVMGWPLESNFQVDFFKQNSKFKMGNDTKIRFFGKRNGVGKHICLILSQLFIV